MTDNLQLQTSRLTNASAGNLIDDALADIENCIRVLFKITADTPISQVMSITSAGNVTLTGNLTLSGAPTNNLHAATKKYVDDNTSTGGDYKCKVYVATTEILAGATDLLVWGGTVVEEGSTDQWDSGDPTKMVCKSAGDYLISLDIYIQSAGASSSYSFDVNLLINGVVVVDNIVGYYNTHGYGISAPGILYTLAENDYIQIQVYNPEAHNVLMQEKGWGWGSTMLSMVKVGE